MKAVDMKSIGAWLIVLVVAFGLWVSLARADRPGWERFEVSWRMTGGSRIQAINYPQDRKPPLLTKQGGRRTRAMQRKGLLSEPGLELTSFAQDSATPVIATIIDSPPIGGFTPWIVVSVTDERSDDFDYVAEPYLSVVGNYLTDSPQTDYTIGLFDTGASAHIVSYAAANLTGIYDNDLLTPNTVELIGATNSTFGWVSYPLGVFIDGLGAIEPNGLLLDTSGMVGQSNVSIIVGDEPLADKPDLPNVIGSAMSANFVTSILNDQPITIIYDNNEYESPDIRFYDLDDPGIPDYNSYIPLNLIPLGGYNVQYIPDYEAIFEFIFRPMYPSLIIGNLSQSLFFVNSVDLYDGSNSAIQQDRFMLDTGAQISVVGSGVGSRLGLNPANPDFEVEIQDVTGEITIQPGFYIDSLDIPAIGDWLRFTNVPVVLLDVASPEGGNMDGIIGMNLFIEFNLVLRSGGLPDLGGHRLEFEPIPYRIIADIAPDGGDGCVNYLDLSVFTQSWLATPQAENWNPAANLAEPADEIELLDFAVLAQHWLECIEQ